ncbi:MAG: carbamoylphosphate synthase large subunit [Clostridiales bacterium]|nr:carbamoylphosphate synthase large subunit [Clostridiales bacterium]
MKNFIFISPNFPTNYWKFCRHLKNNGFNVLGIGDCPYDNLSYDLKTSLTEYYKVNSLESYDEVYRAVAFFAFKYGKIDFIESNNEYWLEQDAKLRTDFNIKTGFQKRDVKKIRHKSEMKKYYKKAGVKVARHYLIGTLSGCKKFIDEVGYPVIVKPDSGVGASDTHKIKNEDELKAFLATRPQNYIMEEFIDAEVNSYEAIIDSHGNPIFETGNVTPNSVMDIVNNNDNCIYYMVGDPYPDVRELGRKTVKAFGVKSRFVHFEFFRLLKDQRIGKKGEVVALEVNMRPCGAFSPDMMNYANSTDVYKIWADMIAFDKTELALGEKWYCAFAGRRDGKNFVFSEQDIKDKYAKNLKRIERIPDSLSSDMGNTMFLANFKTKEEMNDFYKEVLLQTK